MKKVKGDRRRFAFVLLQGVVHLLRVLVLDPVCERHKGVPGAVLLRFPRFGGALPAEGGGGFFLCTGSGGPSDGLSHRCKVTDAQKMTPSPTESGHLYQVVRQNFGNTGH